MTFHSYEEIRNRPNFDPGCTISPDNVGALIDNYALEGDLEYQCQVVKEGGRCDEMHRNGWLGCRADDGHEALIGRDCGRKKFNFSKVFRSERKRLNSEQELRTAVERVRKHIDNVAYSHDLDGLTIRLRALRTAIADLRAEIPGEIASELKTRVRDNRSQLLASFRVPYDEDKKGNIIYRWDRPEVIGTIAGLSVWNPEPMRATFATAHDIRDALRIAKPDPLVGARKLKKWASVLDELPRCLTSIAGFEARWREFSTPENLRLLCLLIPNEARGVEMARVVLSRAQQAQASPKEARQYYDALRKSVSALRGNKPFKI
jgi:hypothetical protein